LRARGGVGGAEGGGAATASAKRDLQYVKRDLQAAKTDLEYVKRDLEYVERDLEYVLAEAKEAYNLNIQDASERRSERAP
jgi:hypothetical protein